MDNFTQATVRATNMEQFNQLQDSIFTHQSYQQSKAFQPNASDVFIAPYAKSGTTWLQQITHGLRTRGDMNFAEISDVMPWIEVAHDMGVDINAPQCAEPRLFKTHFNWYDIPKGGRYICALRDPQHVVVSYYRFMEGWFIEPDTIDLDSFAEDYCPPDGELGGYWKHLVSWFEQRDNDNVLLLCYETMQKDLPTTVKQIAALMDISLDDALLETIVRQSSRDFMLANKSHFDERGIRQFARQKAGLPADVDTSKVTAGASQHTRYQLSPRLKARFDAIWQQQVQPRLGFADYRALCKAL